MANKKLKLNMDLKDILKLFKMKSSRQLKFFLLVVIMLAVVAVFSVYVLGFLLSNLNIALSTSGIRQTPPLNFDIAGFERLNLNK